MAKPLTSEQRAIRVGLVQALGDYIREYADLYPEDYRAEQVKQVQRVAKFLCVAN
jgi:hypothetical protein